jgi:hypothetical protein
VKRSKASTGESAWLDVADRRPRRLRRGVDFEGDVKSFAHDARRAAAARQRAVKIARDKLEPTECVWVQVADAAIRIGDPCRCGNTVLRQRHPHFAECDRCGSLLILEPSHVDPDSEDDTALVDDPFPAPALTDFRNVVLRLVDERPDQATYVGLGTDGAGERRLLVVTEARTDGDPIPDTSSPTGNRQNLAAAVPTGAVELTLADGASSAQSWDIRLE